MTTTPTPALRTALLAALACTLPLCPDAVAQKPGDEPEKAPAKPTAWPDLPKAAADRVNARIRRLVHEDEEKRAEAEKDLLETGFEAGKYLLRAITPRKPELHAPVFGLLDRITTTEHSRILAEEARTNDRVEVRRWAVGRLGELHAEDVREELEAACKDEDDEVRFRAHLALCGLGDWKDHLDPVFARCREDYFAVAPRVVATLENQRTMDAAELVMQKADVADEGSVLTALRLMRTVGPKSYGRVVVRLLDTPSAAVKKEAINALRVMIDGDEPIENLAVFRAIGEAKKWKERIQ